MLAWKIWQQYLHLRVVVTLGLELQSRVSCVLRYCTAPKVSAFFQLCRPGRLRNCLMDLIASFPKYELSSWVGNTTTGLPFLLFLQSTFFLGKVFFFLFQMQRVTGPTTTWSKLSRSISRQPGNSFSERPSRGLEFGNQSHTEDCSFQALNRVRDDLSMLVRNRGEWWVAWRCGTEKCWLRNKMLSFKWKTPYLMQHEVASLVTEQVINI